MTCKPSKNLKATTLGKWNKKELDPCIRKINHIISFLPATILYLFPLATHCGIVSNPPQEYKLKVVGTSTGNDMSGVLMTSDKALFNSTVFIAYQKKSSQFRLCRVWGCRLHCKGPSPQELPGNLHEDHLYDSAKHVISPNQKTHSLLVYGTLHRQGEAFLGMFADSGKKEVARLRISTRKRSVFLRLGENSKVTFKEFRFKHVF